MKVKRNSSTVPTPEDDIMDARLCLIRILETQDQRFSLEHIHGMGKAVKHVLLHHASVGRFVVLQFCASHCWEPSAARFLFLTLTTSNNGSDSGMIAASMST